MEHSKIDNLLSISEAAEFIGVSKVTIYNWFQTGKLKPIRVGDHLCLLKEDLEELKKGVVERVETIIHKEGVDDIGKDPATSGPEKIR